MFVGIFLFVNKCIFHATFLDSCLSLQTCVETFFILPASIVKCYHYILSLSLYLIFTSSLYFIIISLYPECNYHVWSFALKSTDCTELRVFDLLVSFYTGISHLGSHIGLPYFLIFCKVWTELTSARSRRTACAVRRTTGRAGVTGE